MKRMKKSYTKLLQSHHYNKYIKIYTEWVNRHLIRYGREPISDLTNDLREPRKLAILLQAITFDCVPGAEERINAAINGNIEPVDIIAECLQFVASLNIDISKIAVNDVLNGHLGAILSLLYGLSTYKQQIKQSLRAANITNAVVQSSESSALNNTSQIIQVKVKKSKDIGRITTMPPSSKLPSPSIRTPTATIHSNTTTTTVNTSNSRLATPTRIIAKEGHTLQTSGATTPSKLASPKKTSSLRAPAIRVHPPSIKTSGLNNNEQSRPSSRSSSLASSGTYTSSIPSIAPSTSASSSVTDTSNSNQKMLKIKFFGGNKDSKTKSHASMGVIGTGGMMITNTSRATTIAEMKNSKLSINRNNDETGKISGLMKPKNSNTKVSRKIPGATSIISGATRDTIKGTGSRTSALPLQSSSSSSSCSNTALQGGIKRSSSRPPQSSTPPQFKQPVNLDPTKNKRFSKSSEEDSAYAGFGSSSPVSSAESSSMSLNSTSSKNSSSNGITANNHPRSRALPALTFHHTANNHRFIGGTIQPPSSPHESKPILAVKGIAAPKVPHLTSPSNKLSPTIPTNSPVTNISSPSSEQRLSTGLESEQQSDTVITTMITSNTPVSLNNTAAATKTTKGTTIPSQSPTVGVVSPMMSHRVIKLPQTSSNIIDGGNQSDTSTTSGSRDSDNASVIYNPIDDINSLSNNTSTKINTLEKKAPPVPVRTNSRLETTFDSNCGVTTSEITTTSSNTTTSKGNTTPTSAITAITTTATTATTATTTATTTAFSGSDLEGIRPMEPIIPLIPPAYNIVIRNGKAYRQNIHSSDSRNGSLRDSSTSDDSLDSISTTIRCAVVPHRPSGYLSEGESLFTGSTTLPELSMADVSNGYMSEGGITVYARKMQARFREGLEAVRDSMRQRNHDFNDSFEDSSSLSSGISENFDDISTDDLTGSSLSDYPMVATTATAYGKLNNYQHHHHQQQQQQQLQYTTTTTTRQPQVHAKRSSSHTGATTPNAIRLQQRRILERENIDQLLQKCRTNYRGIACNIQASPRYNDCGQNAIYHTLGGSNGSSYGGGYGGGGGSNGGTHPVPQLTLSDDGDTLCVRSGSARGSLRMPSKQDHQVQAGPGFTSMAGYHSLDRKTHLLNYYRIPNDNPYRLAVVGQETSAATLAMVSPRHIPSNRQQQFTLMQQQQQQQQQQQNMDHNNLAGVNRHSVAAKRTVSLSSAGMSRSMILVAADCGGSDSSCDSPQLSTPDNTPNYRIGSRSPLMTNSKMAIKHMPLSIAAEIPTLERNFTNRRTGNSLSSRKSQMENVYANYAHRDANLQLHKLSDDGIRTPQMKTSRYAESGYLSATSKLSPNSCSAVEANDSQLSLTSSSNSLYSSMEEKYEAEIRKLNREMQAYRSTITKLTAKHDGYNHIIQLFESKLQLMAKHVENLQNKSQLKKDEVVKLRAEIEQLRVMSINAGVNVSGIATITQRKSSSPQSQDGAGELLRHPSLESVTSHRSSMSSSSKGSKTDKSSLNSFGKQGKKSWTASVDCQIRSSFSKFTKGKKAKSCSVSDAEHSPMHTSAGSPSSLKPISGSVSRLDELETVPQVVELKKQLEDKDSALTDVRLDALDKAREVDILKETINRLKNENKILKQNYTMLERRMRAESRTNSQQSLPTLPDEDPVYEIPPNGERCLNGKGSNCLKVTVSVDFSGLLRPRSLAGEVSIGFIPLPTLDTTWENFDTELFKLFDDYMAKIDSNQSLELNSQESIIGYEFGDFIRDIETNSAPSPIPSDVLTHNHDIRIYLRGVTQRSVDGLVMDCLFPRSTIELLLKALLQNRRLVLFGATGIGKSNLARLLARYLCIKIGGTLQNTIADIKIGDDDNDRNMAQVQKQLESLLRSTKPVIILLDNIQRHRIAFLSSSFNTVDTPSKEGPYVICTVNRASQLPELEIQHNFRMFLLPNNIDAIRGYMGRFLRRRILECEFGGDERSSPEIYRVVEFLPRVLSSVNSFIEKANSRDVTIGPRLFLQCPLSVMQSREWFIKLWNQMIIPYMIKVAKEGVKVLGRCGSFEDPTDFVCEQWPWLEGPAAEQVLQRLSPIKESISNQPNSNQFDPLEALIRIQANNANSQQEVVQ